MSLRSPEPWPEYVRQALVALDVKDDELTWSWLMLLYAIDVLIKREVDASFWRYQRELSIRDCRREIYIFLFGNKGYLITSMPNGANRMLKTIQDRVIQTLADVELIMLDGDVRNYVPRWS